MHRTTKQSASAIVGILLAMLALLNNLPAASAEAAPDPAVHVLTPDYQLDADGISVPGYTWNDAPGAPRLPVYGTVVELPASGDWQITYDSAGSRILDARAQVPAVPVPQFPEPTPQNQAPAIDELGPPLLLDQPDPAIYGVDAFYPTAPVVTGDVQWQRGRRLLAVRVFPFQYNPVTGELRYHPDIALTVHVTPAAAGNDATARSGASTAEAAPVNSPNAVDASAGAIRIRTVGAGMYRLTYTDLLDATVPVNVAGAVDPRSFQMTNGGSAVQIQVTGAADGRFDSGDLVIFYAEAYTGRYMTQNVYWLTYGATQAPSESRMSTRAATPSSPPLITTVMQTAHVEFNKGYYGNYPLPTDADHWFDDALSVTTSTPVTRAYNVTLDDALTTGTVQVKGLFYGGWSQAANPDQSVAVRLNSHAVATFKWDGQTGYTGTATAPASYLLAGAPNQIVLEAARSQLTGVATYFVYPDWVELRYPALADAEGDRIAIEGINVTTSAQVQVTGFTTGAVLVYDVRDPRRPMQVTTAQATNASAPYTITYRDEWPAGSPAPSYSLTTEAALLAPASVELDTPSTWRSAQGQGYDYIAIVHSSLNAAIQPLLARRAAQGLRVAQVDVQDIYDEFSAGLVYPPAIRDFLSYAYHNWNGAAQPPKYVLLVGDGHYDFKGFSSTTLPNLIPPYLAKIDPFIGEVPADNRFVSVDGPTDYLPDMAIGRIPAATADDVINVVNKILAYEQTPDGDWQNRTVMVADNWEDKDGNFHTLSDEIRTKWLAPQYGDHTQRVYYRLDANLDTADEMRTTIKQAFDNPPVLLQWFGHGSAVRWGTVSMFNIYDPVALQANTRLPFTQSYSCDSGYFVNIANGWQALGETLLLQAGRGSVADFSPSGRHITSDALLLNKAVVTAVFRDRIRPVGDAVNAAKLYYFANNHSFPDVIDTTTFFGDPALNLRVPATPPLPPTATLTRLGDSAKLTWPHQLDSASYEVWRGTSPYFDPDAGQGVLISTVNPGLLGAGASFSVIDNGVNPPAQWPLFGDPAHNYFWVVRSRNGDGVSANTGGSTNTNRKGEFDFQLVPGS